jgi:hypothetical protein
MTIDCTDSSCYCAWYGSSSGGDPATRGNDSLGVPITKMSQIQCNPGFLYATISGPINCSIGIDVSTILCINALDEADDWDTNTYYPYVSISGSLTADEDTCECSSCGAAGFDGNSASGPNCGNCDTPWGSIGLYGGEPGGSSGDCFDPVIHDLACVCDGSCPEMAPGYGTDPCCPDRIIDPGDPSADPPVPQTFDNCDCAESGTCLPKCCVGDYFGENISECCSDLDPDKPDSEQCGNPPCCDLFGLPCEQQFPDCSIGDSTPSQIEISISATFGIAND